MMIVSKTRTCDTPEEKENLQEWLRLYWIERLDPEMKENISDISVEHVSYQSGAIKFVTLVAHMKSGEVRTVFIRRDSVAILIVLNVNGRTYTTLVRQTRPAIGAVDFPSIPAGSLEDDDFMSEAIREICEEVGLSVSSENLIDLCEKTWGDKKTQLLPSAGALCERVHLLACELVMNEEELKSLQGRNTGKADEHEFITLDVIPLDSLPENTSDGHSLAAYFLYKKMRGRKRRI